MVKLQMPFLSAKLRIDTTLKPMVRDEKVSATVPIDKYSILVWEKGNKNGIEANHQLYLDNVADVFISVNYFRLLCPLFVTIYTIQHAFIFIFYLPGSFSRIIKKGRPESIRVELGSRNYDL